MVEEESAERVESEDDVVLFDNDNHRRRRADFLIVD